MQRSGVDRLEWRASSNPAAPPSFPPFLPAFLAPAPLLPRRDAGVPEKVWLRSGLVPEYYNEVRGVDGSTGTHWQHSALAAGPTVA